MAQREATMAKEHRGCFSARRGICYVAYSVDMLVGDVENVENAQCQHSLVANTLAEKYVFGHLIHLLCTATCEESVFKRSIVRSHPRLPTCCQCTAVSSSELDASAR